MSMRYYAPIWSRHGSRNWAVTSVAQSTMHNYCIVVCVGGRRAGVIPTQSRDLHVPLVAGGKSAWVGEPGSVLRAPQGRGVGPGPGMAHHHPPRLVGGGQGRRLCSGTGQPPFLRRWLQDPPQ